MSCLNFPPNAPIIHKAPANFIQIINFEENSGKLNNFTRNFDMETATSANHKLVKLRLAALLYILRRKRHRSIQRKKLYLRMSSVLLMHLSMLGRRGGRRGKGAGFDIQTKFCVKFPTPGIQVLVKSIVPRGN